MDAPESGDLRMPTYFHRGIDNLRLSFDIEKKSIRIFSYWLR